MILAGEFFEAHIMYNPELEGIIESAFNPEPSVGNEGYDPLVILPHRRLTDVHRLDTSYETDVSRFWDNELYSRSSIGNPEAMNSLMRNLGVSNSLFLSGLRIMADSIIAYDGERERIGNLRYYPPAIMTFWSGFESYIRYSSELLVITAKTLPDPVRDFLLEQETILDKRFDVYIKEKKFRPVLDRYIVLLKYGYNFEVARGDKYWQNLEAANKLRDYYTHLGMKEAPSVTSAQVLEYMESILLGIIYPSCQLKRTILSELYWLYDIWATLFEVNTEYTEQTFFKDAIIKGTFHFHCTFENVDEIKFPNQRAIYEMLKEQRARRKGRAENTEPHS
jgi:hypothetical protein